MAPSNPPVTKNPKLHHATTIVSFTLQKSPNQRPPFPRLFKTIAKQSTQILNYESKLLRNTPENKNKNKMLLLRHAN